MFVKLRRNKYWGAPEFKGTLQTQVMIRMRQLCLWGNISISSLRSISRICLGFYQSSKINAYTVEPRWVRLFLRTIYHFNFPGTLALELEHVAETDCLVGDEGDLATKVSHLICSHENIGDTIWGKPRGLGPKKHTGRLTFRGGPGHSPWTGCAQGKVWLWH